MCGLFTHLVRLGAVQGPPLHLHPAAATAAAPVHATDVAGAAPREPLLLCLPSRPTVVCSITITVIASKPLPPYQTSPDGGRICLSDVVADTVVNAPDLDAAITAGCVRRHPESEIQERNKSFSSRVAQANCLPSKIKQSKLGDVVSFKHAAKLYLQSSAVVVLYNTE